MVQTGLPGGPILVFEANVFVENHSDTLVHHTLQLTVDHSHILQLAAGYSNALFLHTSAWSRLFLRTHFSFIQLLNTPARNTLQQQL